MEVIVAQSTAVGINLVPISALSGHSLTIKGTNDASATHLLGLWTSAQASGIVRVLSPRLHDARECIRIPSIANNPVNLIDPSIMQTLVPQDALQISLSGSVGAGDIEQVILLVYYANLEGIQGNYITYQQFRERFLALTAVENNITLGSAGGFSGSESIAADFDVLRGNQEYAILGAVSNINLGCVRYISTDLGNIGPGFPSIALAPDLSRGFFLELARMTGLACIPVFNSANRSSLQIDALGNENGGAPRISTQMALLKSK